MNSNQISKAVKLALMAGAAIAAPSAFAADDQSTTTTTTSNNTSSTNLGKIEVTGTRIKRTDVETAQPVTILTQTQLRQTGLTSIGDILQTVTQAGSALNTTFNNGGNGATNVDLRNLGANRVLVLVNGRRWDPSLGGTVDLNTIPVSIIDHVEILQDGASAIYGSDAISGVINIITVKSYNGAEASAYQSTYIGEGHHDGKVQAYDFTIGSTGDKAGVVMNVGYVNQHEVWAGNRDISKEPVRGEGAASGSSTTPFGRTILIPFDPVNGCGVPGATKGATLGGVYGTCDLTLKSAPIPGKPKLSDFRDRTPSDGYNFAPLNYFITPNERTSFYTQGHYDLADNLTFTADVLFNKRNSQQALAPSPLVLGLAGGSHVNGQNIGVGASNPFNPFGKDLNANLSTLNPATQDLLFLVSRRPLEAGLRTFSQNVENAQFTGAFKGYFNLGGNEWDWDLGYTYGDNYRTDVTTGLFNTARLATALDSPGVAPCSSQPGCVPFNIFGGAGTITPAMLNYVLFEGHDVQEQQMRDYSGNINGTLADLPAGPLGLAVGVEYLEFNGFAHPDATTSSGNTSGNVTQPTDGREKTNAEYVEFDIPLVADAPGFKMLDLDLANRWSQFKWLGGIPGSTGSSTVHTADASTARAALKWQPTDSLLVRASWSQGFRAPSLSELFLGNSDSFPAATDPCAKKPGGWDGDPNHFPTSCAPFTATKPHTQPNGQIQSTIGGNPNLTPEHATSKTAGFVYNPDYMPGFDFSLDYYHIELDRQITAISPQIILNGCYPQNGQGTPNAVDCSKLTLTGNTITDILDLNVNIGGIVTAGYDVAAHYKFPSTSAGDFKLGVDWTFLKFFHQIVPNTSSSTGFSTNELAGTTTGFGGFPKQRGNVSLIWNYGDLSASWNMQYIHTLYEPCSAAMLADKLCSNVDTVTATNSFNHLGKTIYHDVQGTYHVDDLNTDFTLGVRNLFDKQPPTADRAAANSFLPAFYRVPGRELYGRISVKF